MIKISLYLVQSLCKKQKIFWKTICSAVGTGSFTDVDLTRADDFGCAADHFFPMSDPAGQTTESEHNGKHVFRDAERTVNYARIEVDIGIKIAFFEVWIIERDFFKLMLP